MSLYLKYRPHDFINLMGQEFIKNTLQKAINTNKVVGAYLLCGPRGTGKTSTARILAKTINCLKPNNGNPCLECDICVDFLDEKLIDIVEIDAASHTGVDNIRDLIERAQFTPTKTKYKVYIIDEVHMLSKGAFNALLKILEEPPIHVKFILATTETHKVPDTIISRCQRYDFKRISDIDIEARLKYIAKNEKVKIDEKSLEYIINNSGGGLRNAISTFEQLISESEIKFGDITTNLGIVGDDLLENFLEKLIQKNTKIIDDFDELISTGKNIKLFFKELLFFTKNKTLEKLKNKEDITTLIKILDVLNDTYSKTKYSMDENLTFLVGILTIINSDFIIKDKKIIKKEIQTKEKTIDKKEKQKPEITSNDLNDIFNNKKEIEKKNIKNNSQDNTSNINFNLNDFINELKKLGAKGALTMAIRGTVVNLDGNNLNIKVNTTIARNQITNVENMTLIKEALVNMGIQEPNLNIN